MKALSSWILVVALALAASCFSGKRGPRTGTNIGTGTGSDNYEGPWSQGGSSPAHTPGP